MKTKLVSLLFIVAVSGCVPQPDGRPPGVEETCIKGVVYYASGHLLAVAMKQDGTPYTCYMTNEVK